MTVRCSVEPERVATVKPLPPLRSVGTCRNGIIGVGRSGCLSM